jgi:hypothetical protein
MSFIKVLVAGVFKVVDTTNVFKVRVAGVWKDVTFLRVYRVSGNPPVGAWKDVWVKNATVPPPPPPPDNPPPPPPPVTLNVVITPAGPIYGSKVGGVPTTVSSGNVTASVSNGTGPYTYTWTRVSWGASPAPTIGSPNAATTGFSQLVSAQNRLITDVFKCTVTDAYGNVGSAQITVQFIVSSRPSTGGDGLTSIQ